MLKKFGAVAVGVGAGLVAMAPLASAGEAPLDSSSHGGHGHSHGHGDPHGHGFSSKCDFRGGHADAASDISGDSLSNIVAQAPTGGNNALNLLDCSSFVNDNGNGNFAHNNLSVFGDDALVG